MVELDCAGFTFVPSGSQLWPFCKRRDPSSTVATNWSIQELSSCALADSRGSFRSRSNTSTSIHVYGLRLVSVA
jgi:hypothetical protein